MSPGVPQSYHDLHEFVAYLERRKQLKRIKTPVSADLEITEITDRVSKSRDKNYALLFENVQGFDIPVLINALGTEERMSWALGLNNLNELRDRMAGLVKPEVPEGMFDKLRKLGELSEVVRYRPKSVDAGPCQELVLTGDQVDLGKLPILKCWPQDGGRYITLPMVISRDPVKGIRNVGMYRLQVYDRNTVGMHWQIHKGGTEHQRESLRQGTRRLEVAVAIASDPASIYAGSAPLPPGIDEILFAGWLRHDRVEMVKCKTIDLEVPANAEIVLEGYVDPAEQRLEGPFGDHTGYYSLPDHYPVMHVTAITRRRRPIYATIIVGYPPQEDYWLGKATERLFLPLMQLVIPEIVDVHMPAEGVFHNLVIVSIKKRYPGQARKVMQALWGMGLMMLAKTIVVVSEHVNVHDLSEVAWRATGNIDPRRDLIILEGPMDDLDHAAPRPLIGGKLGIDATRKTAADGYTREWPPDIVMSDEIKELVDRRWAEYGFE